MLIRRLKKSLGTHAREMGERKLLLLAVNNNRANNGGYNGRNEGQLNRWNGSAHQESELGIAKL